MKTNNTFSNSSNDGVLHGMLHFLEKRHFFLEEGKFAYVALNVADPKRPDLEFNYTEKEFQDWEVKTEDIRNFRTLDYCRKRTIGDVAIVKLKLQNYKKFCTKTGHFKGRSPTRCFVYERNDREKKSRKEFQDSVKEKVLENWTEEDDEAHMAFDALWHTLGWTEQREYYPDIEVRSKSEPTALGFTPVGVIETGPAAVETKPKQTHNDSTPPEAASEAAAGGPPESMGDVDELDRKASGNTPSFDQIRGKKTDNHSQKVCCEDWGSQWDKKYPSENDIPDLPDRRRLKSLDCNRDFITSGCIMLFILFLLAIWKVLHRQFSTHPFTKPRDRQNSLNRAENLV